MEHEIIGEVAKAALETTVIYGSGSVDKKGPGPRAKVAHKALERGMNLLFFTCGMIAVAFVLIISIYLVISGMPAHFGDRSHQLPLRHPLVRIHQ